MQYIEAILLFSLATFIMAAGTHFYASHILRVNNVIKALLFFGWIPICLLAPMAMVTSISGLIGLDLPTNRVHLFIHRIMAMTGLMPMCLIIYKNRKVFLRKPTRGSQINCE